MEVTSTKNHLLPTSVVLETQRLYLHELSPEVYEHLFTTCSDQEINSFYGFTTEEELKAERENFKKGFTTYFISFRNFILEEKATGRKIGRCGFHTWIPKHRRAEVGYHLYHDEDKGKGYMSEALKAVIRHGFDQMNLYRIEALLDEYNTPSLKLLQNNGFQREGIVRGHYVVDGINEDSLLMSLLLPEYQQQLKR